MCLLVQYSLESTLSIFSLAIHLSILVKSCCKSFKIILSVMFDNVLVEKSNWSFVKCFIHGMPPILLVVVWCGVYKFVWIYGICMFFVSAFFSKFVCFFIISYVCVCPDFI